MMLTPKDYARALTLALRDADAKKMKAGVKRFADMLRRRGAEHLLPRILTALPAAIEAIDAKRRITIESTRPLTKPTIAAIMKAIGAAKKSEVVTRNEPSLIGGVRITTKDGIIDASVQGKLATITATLRRAG